MTQMTETIKWKDKDIKTAHHTHTHTRELEDIIIEAKQSTKADREKEQNIRTFDRISSGLKHV